VEVEAELKGDAGLVQGANEAGEEEEAQLVVQTAPLAWRTALVVALKRRV
jgi:hypothetical protein